jgi:hypothetical protein
MAKYEVMSLQVNLDKIKVKVRFLWKILMVY